MDFPVENTNSPDPVGPWRSNMSSPAKPGRNDSYGFLHKLFSRQPTIPKLVTTGLEEQLVYYTLDSPRDSSHIGLGLELMPCPYIRPLGNRLEPRVESAPLAPRRPLADSVISTSRKKEELSPATHSCSSLDEAGEELQNDLSASDIMNLRNLRLREDIAVAATADSRHLKDWGYYIKCYSEGRYSLTVPPGPPPMNSNFAYLPSTYPPNEVERLASFQSLNIWSGTDIVWSSLEAERARSLITDATIRFATPWGAISFFDDDTEIVQAERGYSRHLIPRRESIASHVLLTDEVMTVLDSQTDWRFVGNPLVVGNPKIRFFAGAPLLSASGQVIGVFAIFGPKPRASFTALQRRDLASFSELATRDLTARSDVSSSIDRQSVLSLEQDSCNGGGTSSHRSTSSPQPPAETESHRIPSLALRYHKTFQNGMPRSRVIVNSEGRGALHQNVEYTPPNSDDSDAGTSPILAEHSAFRNNHKQFSLATLPNQPPNDMRSPDSPTFGDFLPNFRHLQPRPISVSNQTPPDQEPYPCMPEFYMSDTSKSFGESRRDSTTFSSDDAAVFLSQHPDSLFEQTSDTCSIFVDSERDQALLEEAVLLDESLDAAFLEETELMWASASEAGDSPPGSISHEPTQYQSNLDTQSSSTADLTSRGAHGLVDINAEARFAAEFWVKNLEFDCIYAVELIPKRMFMTETELKTAGNVETRILVSYGLHDPIDFDIPIHLSVLRASGALTWENNNAMPKEYSRGFMMPLVFEHGILDYRSKGVVFGAFRKTLDGINELPNLRLAEVERLQQAAGVLKGILWKSLLLQRPIHCETGPLPSPSHNHIPQMKRSK